jgi:hypothetical protein
MFDGMSSTWRPAPQPFIAKHRLLFEVADGARRAAVRTRDTVASADQVPVRELAKETIKEIDRIKDKLTRR